MKEVIIDRRFWRRGSDSQHKQATSLLDSRGLMCCLGFHCKQVSDISDEELLAHAAPADLVETVGADNVDPLLIDGSPLTPFNSVFAGKAMTINDEPYRFEGDKHITDDDICDYDDFDREHHLYIHGLKHGVKYRFIN